MQSRILVTLLAAGAAGLISCRDVAPSKPMASIDGDDWAEAVAVQLPPTVPYDANGRIERHFRDRTGTVFSIVAIGDGRGGPPSKIFGFENGRIRYVVKPKYDRRTGGWVRAKSHVTVFDSLGHKSREADSNNEPAGIRSLEAPADVVTANLIDISACFSEWLAYAAASGALAAASSALTAAISACILDPFACGAVESASVAFAAALSAWNAALDRLLACQSSPGGGTRSGTKVLKFDGSIEDIDPTMANSIHVYVDQSLVEQPL